MAAIVLVCGRVGRPFLHARGGCGAGDDLVGGGAIGRGVTGRAGWGGGGGGTAGLVHGGLTGQGMAATTPSTVTGT